MFPAKGENIIQKYESADEGASFQLISKSSPCFQAFSQKIKCCAVRGTCSMLTFLKYETIAIVIAQSSLYIMNIIVFIVIIVIV